MKKTCSMSLSRAHAVCTRINEEIREANAAMNSATIFQVSIPTGRTTDAIMAEIDVRRKMVDEKFKHVFFLHDVLAEIRQKVAQVNVKSGVSEQLALQTAMNHKLTILKQLIIQAESLGNIGNALGEINRQEMVFEKQASLENSASRLMRGNSAQAINVMSAEFYEKIKAEAEVLKRDSRRLADKINSANQKTISIEIEGDLADILGL